MDPETARSIAGHIRPEMTEYYSHQRKRVKYRAVQRIEPSTGRKKPPRPERLPSPGPAHKRG